MSRASSCPSPIWREPVAEPTASAILAAVRSAGFRFVALDLAGIQSGAFTLPLVATHG